MKVKAGDIITFRGCSWHEKQWEFDAPVVLYSPVKRYGDHNSVGEQAVEEIVESVCIDLCVDGEVADGFDESDLKEFKWRKWSPKGFCRRKNAIHAEINVLFYSDPDGELEFEFISSNRID